MSMSTAIADSLRRQGFDRWACLSCPSHSVGNWPLLPGICTRSGSGTATAGGASPLRSAHRSHNTAHRFRDELVMSDAASRLAACGKTRCIHNMPLESSIWRRGHNRFRMLKQAVLRSVIRERLRRKNILQSHVAPFTFYRLRLLRATRERRLVNGASRRAGVWTGEKSDFFSILLGRDLRDTIPEKKELCAYVFEKAPGPTALCTNGESKHDGTRSAHSRCHINRETGDCPKGCAYAIPDTGHRPR